MAGEIELLPVRRLSHVIGHDSDLLAGRSPRVSTPYLGQVATRGLYPEGQFGGSLPEIRSRIQHFARANMDGARFKYVNYKGPSEDGAGGTLTLTVGIEYPLGSFTRLTFGGEASASIASGGDVLSDPLPLFIPDGALFREWTLAVWSGGVNALYGRSSVHVDLSDYGSGLADNTLTGATAGMSGGLFVYGATAIIGMTDKPSVLIIDNSRGVGATDRQGTNCLGPVGGPMGGAFGTISLACSGAAMWQFRVNATDKLVGLATYCSHVCIGDHINDLVGGDSAAACKSNAEGLISRYAGGKPAFVATVPPYTTSTDGWTSETNQTVWSSGQDAERMAFNDMVRAGSIIGMTGYFDIAGEVESRSNPGKWLAPGYTSDGLHGTRRADLAAARIVNPALFGSKAFVEPAE